MAYLAIDKKADLERYQYERALREKWWAERSILCSCPHEVPVRRYLRAWVCALCSGFIR